MATHERARVTREPSSNGLGPAGGGSEKPSTRPVHKTTGYRVLALLNKTSQGLPNRQISPDNLLKFPGYKPKVGQHARSGSKSSTASESSDCLVHYAPHQVSPEPEVNNGSAPSETREEKVTGKNHRVNSVRNHVVSTWKCGLDNLDGQESLDEHNSSDETLEDSGIYIREGVVNKPHPHTKTRELDSPGAAKNSNQPIGHGSPLTNNTGPESLRKSNEKTKGSPNIQKSVNSSVSTLEDAKNNSTSNINSSDSKTTSQEPTGKAATERNIYENLPPPKDSKVSEKGTKDTKDDTTVAKLLPKHLLPTSRHLPKDLKRLLHSNSPDRPSHSPRINDIDTVSVTSLEVAAIMGTALDTDSEADATLRKVGRGYRASYLHHWTGNHARTSGRKSRSSPRTGNSSRTGRDSQVKRSSRQNSVVPHGNLVSFVEQSISSFLASAQSSPGSFSAQLPPNKENVSSPTSAGASSSSKLSPASRRDSTNSGRSPSGSLSLHELLDTHYLVKVTARKPLEIKDKDGCIIKLKTMVVYPPCLCRKDAVFEGKSAKLSVQNGGNVTPSCRCGHLKKVTCVAVAETPQWSRDIMAEKLTAGDILVEVNRQYVLDATESHVTSLVKAPPVVSAVVARRGQCDEKAENAVV